MVILGMSIRCSADNPTPERGERGAAGYNTPGEWHRCQSVVEVPLDGQLKIEDELIPVEGEGHAGLVLVVFVDKEAALGKVGFVAEAGSAAGASLVEFHPQHPQGILLAELDPAVTHLHQPLQQGEEVLLVGLDGPSDGLLQFGGAGKGGIQRVAGLDAFLSHIVLLMYRIFSYNQLK